MKLIIFFLFPIGFVFGSDLA